MIKIARIAACESAFNGIMFSGYIVSVSFILQFMFGIKKGLDLFGIVSMVECVILLASFILYFVLIIRAYNYFGEFVFEFRQRNEEA